MEKIKKMEEFEVISGEKHQDITIWGKKRHVAKDKKDIE